MAYVAIVVTMIFGSLFVGVSGIMDTTVRYEDTGGDVLDDQDVTQLIQDSDDDGLSDQIERTQYGTDTLTTQVFDCTEDPDGDSSTWKNMNCSSISEFWESVKYRDTIQARVQIHKFYAMRSKAGGEKKRAGLGFKFVHVKKVNRTNCSAQ